MASRAGGENPPTPRAAQRSRDSKKSGAGSQRKVAQKEKLIKKKAEWIATGKAKWQARQAERKARLLAKKKASTEEKQADD